ncbi:UGSC family (seleno)protein [Mycobacterium simiae]|uniref:UGSC family (seleno)protein n=1 Tax=Mycobacterium simiae TaxID=1784 RepID=UPI00165FB275|nr:UGSC family (seleno)protein [Mycobacterium simiae]
MTDLVYDPRGVIEVDAIPLAPRPSRAVGLRLGVLSNTKWNAAKLLRATVRQLGNHALTFAAINYYDKHHFSSDASTELIGQIAAENDMALTAIGDCGSCCSACVNDAVRLESAGLPTVVIVTTEFEHEARLQRESRGMAGLQPAVTTHPISSLTLDQLESRADEITSQALRIWFGAAALSRGNGKPAAVFGPIGT